MRHSTGIPALDEMLGGGLLPGTLTVVLGATGIGKTQLGLQYANAGLQQEQRRGVVFDVSARGDSQNHADYARRMFNWTMTPVSAQREWNCETFFDSGRNPGDYLHVFDYHGRRVTRRDLEVEEWQDWQAELNARLRATIAFLYGNFIAGTRRIVVDGIEPVDRPQESIQFHLFEYIYHQVVRKDPAWVARDLLRESYRRHAADAERFTYSPGDVGCLLLYTSHESMLEELISRPLDEGDSLSNANTLILLGKLREGNRIRRAMYIAKHRGSACCEDIRPYEIHDGGLVL